MKGIKIEAKDKELRIIGVKEGDDDLIDIDSDDIEDANTLFNFAEKLDNGIKEYIVNEYDTLDDALADDWIFILYNIPISTIASLDFLYEDYGADKKDTDKRKTIPRGMYLIIENKRFVL